MSSPRTCRLGNCTSDHRVADSDFTYCDRTVGSFRDAESDRMEVHATVSSANADAVPHVCVMINDHDAVDCSPAVARLAAAAMLTAADLAEAGALR